jgi:hypothetical protein
MSNALKKNGRFDILIDNDNSVKKTNKKQDRPLNNVRDKKDKTDDRNDKRSTDKDQNNKEKARLY